jgi:excisionase family DNA binding protein/PAS domain S-box-containing protein
MDEYLTTDQIARRLGVKVATVRRWVHQGKLHGLSLGRAGYRILQEDFEHFVQRRDQQPVPLLSKSSGRSPLSDGEEEFRLDAVATLILERMTDGVLFFGPDGLCQYANESAAQILDVTSNSLLGQTMAQVLPDRADFFRQDAEGSSDDFFSTATGRWFQLRTFEAMQGRCLTFFDITERKLLEAQLRESRAEIERQWRFFDTTLSNISGFVFVWNRQKQFVYANQALEQLWSIERGAYVGKTTADLGYPPELSELLSRHIEQVFKTGEDVTDEVPYTSPTGLSGYYEYILSPIFAEDGSVEFVAGTSIETTKRRLMEQALREAEQRIQAERQKLYDLFMQAPAIIVVLRGPDHIIDLANPLALQFIGTYRSLIGKPIREAIPELEGLGFHEMLDTVFQTGKSITGNEIPAQLDRTGAGTLEKLYFNFVYQPSYNATSEIDGVIIFATEITKNILERKRAEDSEERLRVLANSMPQLAWSARSDGAIDFFNERVNEYATISQNEESTYEWQAIIHPDDSAEAIHDWDHATRTGSVFEHELRLQMKDGTYRWHLARGLPIHDAQGSVLRWYGTQTDIEQLKRLDQQKNNFLGVVSHELKTPVTSVKAFAEVLESRFRKAGDEKNALLLGKMHTQMGKLTQLIGDLLDVAKLEAGKLQFHQVSFAFDDLVQDMIEEVQRTTALTIQREGITSATVYGDRERIGQVLTNLLTNAIKYSPNATKVVVTSSCTQQEVTLCVQDFGIGIAKEKLPQVFERFFRVAGTREETFPGLGLGLYVSAEIIQRHGGKIWVESVKGSGSTFCFTLPLQANDM